MSGPWAVILAVVVMFAAVYCAALVLGRARTTQRVRCDLRKADFDVTFDCRLDARWETGRKVEVVACSAFADPASVQCDRACLASAA